MNACPSGGTDDDGDAAQSGGRTGMVRHLQRLSPMAEVVRFSSSYDWDSHSRILPAQKKFCHHYTVQRALGTTRGSAVDLRQAIRRGRGGPRNVAK